MKEDEIEFIEKEERFELSEAYPGPSTSSWYHPRENTTGILRVGSSRPRQSSGSSVEFKIPRWLPPQECTSLASPQSIDENPSVTFASDWHSTMDKVRFQSEAPCPSDEDDDEDYSQSVSAIFQRKASTRCSRKRRRSSSPMFPQDLEDVQGGSRTRRRSSVFTTSSGDTAIDMEDAVQEQILQTIKLHKEVLSSVKLQPWSMRRKLRLVRQAKAYIRRHEGALQERLAQSRSTRDILARVNILIVKHWQHTKRELANLMNVLIPWEIRIKEIESHFGSVVASYFTFLRWLFGVNLVTGVVLIVFVAVPEILMANTKKSGLRKKMLEDEKGNATNLFTLWDFEGVLKYSPLFYGYYSNQDPEDKSLARSIGYTMPLAYFLTELGVYIYSFVAILRRMAENSRQSKLSEKDDECVFTWKLFTGWDYMIGNSETAHNRTASIILGFKEALLEEAEKKRDEGRNWKVTGLRVFAHINVLWLLGSSVYAVVLVVERSTQPEAEHGWWRRNESTIIVSLITAVFPAIFEGLGIIEQYHPRKKLRMQLARIMALNLLNIYTLIFASFSKINEMSNTLQSLRPNASFGAFQPPTPTSQIRTRFSDRQWKNVEEWNSTEVPETRLHCKNVTVPCTSSTIGWMTTVVSVLATINTSGPVPSTSDVSSYSSSPTLPFFAGVTDMSSLVISESTESSITTTETMFDFNSASGNPTTSDQLTSDTTPYSSPSDQVEYTDLNDMFEFSSQSDENADYRDIYSFVTTEQSTTEQKQSLSEDVEFEKSTEIYDSSTLLHSKYNFLGTSPIEEFKISTTIDDHEVSPQTNPTSPGTSSLSTPAQVCIQTECEVVPVERFTSSSEPPIEGSSHTFPMTTRTTPASLDSEVPTYTDLTSYIDTLDLDTCKKLRPLCWETMFGREMVKLTVMDLVMTVVSTLMVDFFRAVFVRFMNNCWCWDLEKKFPQYGDFKMAENILHLVNNQGMVWMGMFFAPGLPLINIIKLAIMMYLRSWAVLTCNVPHEVVFRASRSNNFYLALLLTMLFLCVLPVGYAVVWVVPSWHCGPFSNYHRIYHIFTKSLKKALPYKSLHKAFDYIASPGIVIPLLMLLVLIIYYLISLTNALREANNDLKIQLRRERTEERRKMFQLVDKKRQEAENPAFKWRKVLPNFPHGKLSIGDIPIDILKAGAATINGAAKYDGRHKDLIEEFMKKAKRMPSGTSEEENGLLDAGDGTDLEQHDSLPYDVSKIPQSSELPFKKEKMSTKVQKEESLTKKSNKRKMSRENQTATRDRTDSVTSGWSDIPQIRIIQTESAEKLDDTDSHLKTKGSKTIDNSRPSKTDNLQAKKHKHKETRTNSNKEYENKTKVLKREIDKSNNKIDVQEKSENENNKTKISGKVNKHNSSKTNESVSKYNPNNENLDYDIEEAQKDVKNKNAEKRIKKNQSKIREGKQIKNKQSKTKQVDPESEENSKTVKFKKHRNDIDNKDYLSNQSSSKLKPQKVSRFDNEEKHLSENRENDKDETDQENEEYNSENDESDSEYEEDVDDEHGESEENDDNDIHIYDKSNSDDSDEDGGVRTKIDNVTKGELKQTKSRKPHITNKRKTDSLSEESDASSQNTVKQSEMQLAKENEDNATIEANIKDKGEMASGVLSSKEQKNAKKALARFKIANVLLKESRRRSAAGLEEV